MPPNILETPKDRYHKNQQNVGEYIDILLFEVTMLHSKTMVHLSTIKMLLPECHFAS